MQNTNSLTNSLKDNLKSSAKLYISGVTELIRLEAASKLKNIGTKAWIFVLLFVIFSLAGGWLSFALVSFLSRSITVEAASAVMGILLLLSGYLLMQTQKQKQPNKADDVLEKVASPQKQILLNQIESSKSEFLESAKEVKSVTLETLNPAHSIKTVVTNNPGIIILGGFALGVFLGTKNMRARPVRLI